ncbi:aromatic ring-hydroxylating oxygenase subunit alpha [Pleionea sediminis]|uniref:aromatic ring-hydroxylating oxygenase subunit alpha n=1 Tax=Pleionea sediminis TaxID=2569479 RepID=UPI0011855A49|nr:aromatic ring-hydroxylating dioxygenase subunit alpha [Pleionea sediminis]
MLQYQEPLRETCGKLSEYWYAAMLSKKVTRKKPQSVVIMDTRIVLWRKKDGSAVALRDRCSHRNVMLSTGEIGVKEDCIKCPYHGWEFNELGDCINVPSESEHGKAFNNRKVEFFPVIEQEGLIWVWMGFDKEPDAKKRPFNMPFYNTKDWGTYYMVTDFDNNVTSLAENFMDVPHTVFVHKGWFRSRSRKQVDATVERTENSVLVTYYQEQDEIGFTDRILNPNKRPLFHTDKFYMPNNTRVDYLWRNPKNNEPERGFVITSTCTPISALKTRVYTCISYKLGLLNYFAPVWLPWYTKQVINQDVDIMANQGQSFREAPPKFKSTQADTLHLYIESLRDYEESDQTLKKPSPRTREITFWI